MQVYKYLLIIGFGLSSLITVSQETEHNESEQSFIVGFGPTLELSHSLAGINGRFYYGVNESFCFGPEISYFPYQNTDKGYEKSIIDLNINAHYIFELNESLGVYPLSGINYTIENERFVEENDEHKKENGFGINYGVGIHYKLKDLFIFSEFKGIAGNLNDEFITIGFIYNFYNKN
ncbi:outer membrane beta-barrel protein [Polaribacter sp. Asnod6-C07]|uniref:outer membrane beta-barrel protein n=1 Tax=Polaribacter sp. Asnod6-C07 TaxID=3160582 RepID=UPI00386EE6DD